LMFDRPGSRIMQMRVRHLLFMHKEDILFCFVSVFIHLQPTHFTQIAENIL
jgi:hypothetical protein